jgi:hypothetical protein
MKMVKSLVLGSAAALVAMGGAQAADLPVKAKAVEYVRICSLYGAGFWYIPGTDTCIKLGGYLRVDTTFNGSIYDQPAWSGDLGQRNRFMDNFASRSRFALTVDTRTATEYGVVRTFAQGTGRLPVLDLGIEHLHPAVDQRLFAGWRVEPARYSRRRLCGGRIRVPAIRRVHLW